MIAEAEGGAGCCENECNCGCKAALQPTWQVHGSEDYLVPLRRLGGKRWLKLAEGVMIDAVVKKLSKIFHATQFSVRTPKESGGCDRSAETEEHGGPRRSSGGHRSQQCVWQHVVCVGSCADSLPKRCWEYCARSGKNGSTTAWLQTADGWTGWTGSNGERGTWQGALAANPTFCLALHQALLDTRKKTETGQDP